MITGQLLIKEISMSSKPQPTVWSCDTDQRIPCFDSCHLTIHRCPILKICLWQWRYSYFILVPRGRAPFICSTPRISNSGDLWPGSTPEVRPSNLMSKIPNEKFVHSPKIGSGKRSRFLMLTKRRAASGDENALIF